MKVPPEDLSVRLGTDPGTVCGSAAGEALCAASQRGWRRSYAGFYPGTEGETSDQPGLIARLA